MSVHEQLFSRAKKSIAGGVNSPVRAFGGVGGVPRFIQSAKGAFLTDASGASYIDYVGSWGPMILGHAHPDVIAAVQKAAEGGLSFGAPTEGEIEIAEYIQRLMPSMERLRLVSSGTEATMSAIRLARGFTKRDKIIKFEGCYHGHSDSLLVKAGSGLLTFACPSSAGVPDDFTRHTLVLEYNNVAKLVEIFEKIGEEIACVIVEPIAGNMNLVRPSDEFVRALRQLTAQSGALLIYDEVMTGFRVALGGAQSLHGVTPDLTTLGKVVGGGMPMAAFGGRADVMAHIAPEGGVYQAGTLSGNPLAVAAGLATLHLVAEDGFHSKLEEKTRYLMNNLAQLAQKFSIPLCTDFVGGMFGLYFSSKVPTSYADVMSADILAFRRFFHAMLNQGVYFAPSAFEAGFMSAAHDQVILDDTLSKAESVFASW